MKKIYIFAFIFLFSSCFSFASDYSNFKNADSDSIKAFTRDIGNIVGGSVLYSARALGFGGFSVNYKYVYQIKLEYKDTIFEKNKAFGIKYLQVETGLPYRIDTYIRAGGKDGFNVIGGGIRYGLKNVTDENFKPNMILALNSHMGVYKDFYVLSYGAQLGLSMRISSHIMPFVSSGMDSVKLKVKSSNDIALINKSFYQRIIRSSAGLRFKFNWINMAMAYELYEKRGGFNASLGVRF